MRTLTLASAATLLATTALGGGIDRSGQSIAPIFESGNYAELSYSSVRPDVSGTAVPARGGRDSGDMAGDYSQVSAALKMDINDSFSVALIMDQPFGADVDYQAGTFYYLAASNATLSTQATTLILKYTTPSNISVYGGIRHQEMDANVTLASPIAIAPGNPTGIYYTAIASSDSGTGYLLGVAYEKPEIALRVSLTYNSEIDTTHTTIEGGNPSRDTPVTTPKSVNLDFQTGIAADTLLFGSMRWVELSSFELKPALYAAGNGGKALVDYDDDTIGYTLGIGRRLNENWSVAATLGYEKSQGGFASNLGPRDGYKSLGLGATYTQDNMKISAGVRYVDIGDAQTTLDDVNAAANFSGNSALAFGVKVGFSF